MNQQFYKIQCYSPQVKKKIIEIREVLPEISTSVKELLKDAVFQGFGSFLRQGCFIDTIPGRFIDRVFCLCW